MPQRPGGSDGALSLLNPAIEALNQPKTSSTAPGKAVFGPASLALATIRDSVSDEQDYVELGLFCVEVCQALDRGLSGKSPDHLSQSVLVAIEKLTAAVAEIQKQIVKRGKRNQASRLLHVNNDRKKITTWRRDFRNILHVFNTELLVKNHTMLSDIHRKVSAGQEDADCRHQLAQSGPAIAEPAASCPHSVLGESPPPPPRACFGRGDLIESIVGLAENFEPIALIGAGGIGKTSIALAVLHHTRIIERFRENRRFIHCDQFPASRAHFLARLSKAIGAAVENPEDLTPLRPFLSSKEIFLILDNIEPILDPQGENAQEIYAIVEELCQFRTICVCITSRITAVPQHCRRPVVPQLTMKAACNIFYNIYDDGGRSDIIKDLVQRLDFHALSITLLATTASRNMWDYDRLAKEWDTRRAQVLRTDFNQSLATTIELSLASPTFQKLGDGARDLLGVVAFFPQGVNEKNIDRLFPTIPNRESIFDKFCALSLTHRSNGFITMLAPVRDYLCPRNPKSSPSLCVIKDYYFDRLSVDVTPDQPGFRKARWIMLEDVNVEHLLDVFTSFDPDSNDVWNACANFMLHLYWHNKRHTVLKSKVEGLPDDHRSKPKCLFQVARLFGVVGNHAEEKRVFTHVLKLSRERGDYNRVALTLRCLADVNRMLDLCGEGIQQVEEASEIFLQLGDTIGQAHCLYELAVLLYDDNQLDAAEQTVSRMLNLLPEKGEEFLVCNSRLVLGDIYRSKGEREKAIRHFGAAIRIASDFNWYNSLFWGYHSLARLFCVEGRFDEAHVHIGQAELNAVNNSYNLGRATEERAWIWYQQWRYEEATSEILRALQVFRQLGVTEDIKRSTALFQVFEMACSTPENPPYLSRC